MAVIFVVKSGKLYFECDECGMSSTDSDDVAYGHDCEA